MSENLIIKNDSAKAEWTEGRYRSLGRLIA